MATLLTVCGLLEWFPDMLSGLDDCIDYNLALSLNPSIANFFDYECAKRAKTKIILECGMLESIFQNPEIMATSVNEWVYSNRCRWSRLYATTQYKYDPIYNYDRIEEWEDVDSENEKHNGNGNSGGNSTSEHKVGAYNNAMQKAGEDSSSGTSQFTQSGNREVSRTKKHRARLYGNIGVTTTQEMIEAERRVISFDIADIIAGEFRKQFCVAVY